MSRSFRVILVALIVAIGVGAGAYFSTKQICACRDAGDDLAWLKDEFRLSDADMRHIRELHEGYLPKCREMCAKIAVKRDEIESALSQGQPADQKLLELATLRAQCQGQMLKHFEEVSHAMPAGQGRRYLSEMQKLTLGFHQDFENSMAPGTHSEHNHGGH